MPLDPESEPINFAYVVREFFDLELHKEVPSERMSHPHTKWVGIKYYVRSLCMFCLPVSLNGETTARWTPFIYDTTCSESYLSSATAEALGIKKTMLYCGAIVSIDGRQTEVFDSSQRSSKLWEDWNVIGNNFFRYHTAEVRIPYSNKSSVEPVVEFFE